MKTQIFALAALTLAAGHGAAFATIAAPAPTDNVLQARADAHAARMRLIGLTARAGEQPATLLADQGSDALQTSAQRQQQYVQRMALIGRTAQPGESAPAVVAEAKPAATYAARVQQYEQRMALIGRTAQPGEAQAQLASNGDFSSKAFSTRKNTVSSGY
ncbi:MAG: hypothetical protein ABI605_12990 [Rhizobacter sp.]